MKRLLSSIMFVLMACSTAFSQSAQNGIVKEYNDAKKKTPLAGVEIVVNNAGSNVSEKNGKFVLSFRTLKPGDKVEVRKIEKAGYEIFNKDALDAWRIANDGSEFTIVLCKSAKFKALKDQYNAVASKSYAQQQKKDEERLASLLKEGKLQQAEYEKKLKELKVKYDEQLENLDNYIDRFARIDLETISKEEQRIIEMVKAGNIEEAIAAYEAMNLEEKYAQAVENIGIASNAISQLEKIKADNENTRKEAFFAVKRMNDARRLQGGEGNYKKIGESLKRLADSDTTYLVPLYEYADFAYNQNDIKEASKYYDIILLKETDIENKAVFMQRYSNACVNEDANKSLRFALEAEHILDSLIHIGKNEVRNKNRILNTYNSLANAYSKKNINDKAEHYYLLCINTIKELGIKDTRMRIEYATFAHNLGFLYLNNKKYELAIEFLEDAYQTQSIAVEDSCSLMNKNILFNCILQLGTAYGKLDNLEKCKYYQTKAETIYQDLLVSNPQAYRPNGVLMYNQVGSIFHNKDLNSEAEENFAKALACAEECFKELPSLQNKVFIIVTRGNLGSAIANQKGRSKEGADLIEQSLSEMSKLWVQNPEIFKTFYNILLQQKANALAECCLYEKAMETIDEVMKTDPDNAELWDVKGFIFSKMDNWEDALKCWQTVMNIDSDFLLHFDSKLHNALTRKGLIDKK